MTVRIAGLLSFTALVGSLRAEEASKVIVNPNVETQRMGGVDPPGADALKKMHASQYALRAANGKVTRIPVSRVWADDDRNVTANAPQTACKRAPHRALL